MSNLAARRQRQAALYEEQMGREALNRQVVTADKKTPYREPNECDCGWKGGKARSFGTHHSITCPRFEV